MVHDFTDQSNYQQAIITGGESIKPIGIEKEGEIFKWIIVDGNETRYLVSNKGRIYSTIDRELIVPKVAKRGYLEVTLRVIKGSKPRTLRLHRIVIGCFYKGETPETLETVNHINGDKGDNRIENLEYCSITENNRHFARELKHEQKQTGELLVAKMREYRDKIDEKYRFQQSNCPRGMRDITNQEYYEIKNWVDRFYPDKEICIMFNIKMSVIKTIKDGDRERIPRDQLSESTVIEICKDLQEGILTQSEIVHKYNVRWAAISGLISRDWKKFLYIRDKFDF